MSLALTANAQKEEISNLKAQIGKIEANLLYMKL